VSRSVLLLLLLSGSVFAGTADVPAATYYATASEVRVRFFTTDKKNHPVDTVQKDDFAIVDSDTVIREFRSLSRSDETALDLLIMVDASESVAPRFRVTIDEVLKLVTQGQVASDDNVSVVSFAGLHPSVICAGDCRDDAARQNLLMLKPAGATPLFDALAYAAKFISGRRAPGQRPVVILFSDGDDTISVHSAEDALQAVIASGALLYTIDVNKPGDSSDGSVALQRMADATGGRSFSIREGAANVLESVLEDLRASYVVTYPLPSTAAGFHSLRMLPKHNLNLRFHCRNGYYYGTRIP
jgi:VWFA-related protein